MRWVALAFDKKTDRLSQEIELTGLRTENVMRIVGADSEDDVIGVSIEVGPALAAEIEKRAGKRLDLDLVNWQIEARNPRN